jgi:hypothetical protein
MAPVDTKPLYSKASARATRKKPSANAAQGPGVIANVPFVGRALTMLYHCRILILRWLDLPDLLQRQWSRAWQLDPAKMPDALSCIETVAVASLVLTIFSALWFSRSESAVKTPESSS